MKYWLEAVGLHSLQAPFIYELHKNVLAKRRKKPRHPEIEEIRNRFKASPRIVKVVDHGAGSQKTASEIRKVSDIATYGLTHQKYAELMADLIDYLSYKNIMELGTSLGVNALYLSRSPKVRLTTFEGAPELATMATELLNDNRRNVAVITGNIDESLPRFLKKIDKLDFIFFDANHRYRSTLKYFDLCLEYSHEQTCFVFDDIHLTTEMESAWQHIIDDNRVTLSVDIYQLGIVFINPGFSKQHYVLEI